VAGQKIRLGNKVGPAYGFFAEPQVGYGESPGFFGVIGKVGLGAEFRLGVPDDFN
jgi:hypothetical protein